MSAQVLSTAGLGRKSIECAWSISVSFSLLHALLHGSRGEGSVQGGGELVFGLRGPWTQILSLSTAAAPPPSRLPHNSVAVLTLRASPASPASLMKSDTRPEDLI